MGSEPATGPGPETPAVVSEPEITTTPREIAECRTALLGLGLMGGSLAMALHGQVKTLIGADPDPNAQGAASRLDIFDWLSGDPAEILPNADLILLTAPVRAILELISRLPDLHPGSAMVIDIGSTKVEVAAALSALPARFSAVGGHPMCGKERGGLDNADPAIFANAPFVFVSLPNTTSQARGLADSLARAVGAHPLWMDPALHDRWVATTSHVAYLLAAGLVRATPRQAAPLVGPGWRSTARLAGSSPAMMLDVILTNKSAVREALARVRKEIEDLEKMLARSDHSELEEALRQARSDYETLLQLSEKS